MCGAVKLAGIVRANVRLNIAIPMLFWSLIQFASMSHVLQRRVLDHLRSFAPFCGLALRCERPRFERLRLGTPESSDFLIADWGVICRRRTNVQQLTCKIDSSNSFYYLLFSFIILELKPLVLKRKVRGEK